MAPATTYYVRAYATNSAGTGYGSQETFTTAPNPAPAISSISPSSVTAGAASQTLTVNGSDFLSSSVVNFNGTPRTTAFVSASRLTILLTAADQATAGTYDVTVTNPAPGGGTSAATTFTVNAPAPNPVPTISSLTPSSVFVGTASQTLTVAGTNFLSSSVVSLNGITRTTAYVSPSQLTITLTAADQATVGTYDVTVTNPAPGGGTSGTATFTVAPNPVPTISGLAPSTAVAGSAGFSLVVTGNNFVTGSTATFNGTTRAVTYNSPTQLTVAVLAGDIATAGSYNLAITNPAPGGGTTTSTFTVTSAPANSTLLLYSFPNRTVAADAPPASSANVSGSNFSGTNGRTTATNVYATSNYNNNGSSTRISTNYVSFSVTPNANYQMSLSELSFKDQSALTSGGGLPPTSVDVLYSSSSSFSNPQVVGTYSTSTTLTPRSFSFSNVTALQNVTGTVYFRIFPYGGTNGSAVYTVDDVKLDGNVAPIPALVFYSKATGNLNTLATFGTNTDGTGTAPTSFTAANSTYNITGTNRTIATNWVVSGTNSKAVLTAGASFIVPAGFTYTGRLDQAANSTLIIANPAAAAYTNITQTIVQDVTSTIEFAQASGTYTVPASLAYQNLKLTGGTKLFAAGETDVFGTLTLDNISNVAGADNNIDGSLVVVDGNVTLLNTVTFDLTSATRINLSLSGGTTQTISGNGNTLRLRQLRTISSGTNAVLADANGGTPVETGTAGLSDNGGVELTAGSTLALNSNTLSFMPGGAAIMNNLLGSDGTLTLTPASSLNLETTGDPGYLQLTNGASTLNDLRLMNGSSYLLFVSPTGAATTLTVNGTLTLGSNTSQFGLGASHTLVLNGTIAGPGALRGSSNSSLSIGGTGALGTVAFASGAQMLQSFILNRTGNGSVTLGSPLTLSTALTLTNGVLQTAATNLPLLGNSVAVTASETGYVNGPLRRAIAAVNSSRSVLFPIGKDGAYRPAKLNIATQSGNAIYQAELINQSGGINVTAPVQRVSNFRYVTLTSYDATGAAVMQPGGFSGTITLRFGTDDQVTDSTAASIVVAKRSDSAQPWVSIGRFTTGTATPASGSFQAGTLTSGNFTSFSDFALASTDADRTINPLPVQLSSFGAQRQAAQGVAVKWTTATEKNAAYFEVQRSLNTRDFVTVATAQAQGTSSRATAYAVLDKAAPAAALYYRLRQVDADGTVAFSPVVAVAGSGEAAKVLLYPNPTSSALHFIAETATPYRVLNQLGQAVLQGTTEIGTATVEMGTLPAGLYFLELQTPNGRNVQKFEKQ
ncbi:beta strand repeat-containing protein [Hymenobacter monticola]|uniref:T9SS type A sorting domain-containing protein n=1 Tax=Hymenobacter monticola TaxID=1705399 RepID=A0ABY4B017_9BACT|nr:T9SS type A sorting domain-containing protein [Hymenobacter monticola]UOE32464.1 T9SS type A sorting domain-containing protein [Hymenobacter monticola]